MMMMMLLLMTSGRGTAHTLAQLTPSNQFVQTLRNFTVLWRKALVRLDDDVVVTSPAERFMDHPYIHLYIDKYIP